MRVHSTISAIPLSAWLLMFASVISGLLLLQLPLCKTVREERLAVYGPVPGLPPSPYYSLQVRVETSHWSRSIQILCSDWCCHGVSNRMIPPVIDSFYHSVFMSISDSTLSPGEGGGS